MPDTIRVAGVQMDLKLAATEQNLTRVFDAMQTASRAGADLAVFPECALTGYCFYDLEEARAYAQPVPGPYT
ncbi:MAG: carbon-nitrogen hydrolase family protein, partial [Gemmatimonadetes bacterium]|nr:carbon-nitrogen hydrolase family protein [Gemmatimonadota bacterium]